jgi:drug/metabolite transporter (DMT)-like permease
LGVNAFFLWIYLWAFSDRLDLLLPVNLVFVAVGIFVPGVARYFIFKAMERLGASISSCLANASPLFAIVMAVLWLGEQPTATNVVGALFIVTGIVALSWRGSTKTWQTKDLIFPLAASFLFAARDNLVRLAVLQISSPVLGAAIAATTSFLTMALLYGCRHKRKPQEKSRALGFVYFGLAGLTNFLAYVLVYTALSLEGVSIVSPLVNCSSLFVLPLSALFLKGVETLTGRIIGATLLVILGVFLISWEKI